MAIFKTHIALKISDLERTVDFYKVDTAPDLELNAGSSQPDISAARPCCASTCCK